MRRVHRFSIRKEDLFSVEERHPGHGLPHCIKLTGGAVAWVWVLFFVRQILAV
jgi:hypothetical protein